MDELSLSAIDQKQIILDSQKSLELGKRYFSENNFEESEKELKKSLEGNIKSDEAFFFLANIFHARGEIGKAIKAFQQTLQINPSYTDANISLSILYNDIGQYEEAKIVFARANEKVKNNSNLQGMGIDDPHINKRFSAKHYELAEMYSSYERFDEALFEYDKAFALNTNNLEIRVKISKCYAKKGFVGKAFEELKKLKNEEPSYIPGRLALGVLYYGQGNILEAQNEWLKVLSLDQKNQEAKTYLNLAKTATETTLN